MNMSLSLQRSPALFSINTCFLSAPLNSQVLTHISWLPLCPCSKEEALKFGLECNPLLTQPPLFYFCRERTACWPVEERGCGLLFIPAFCSQAIRGKLQCFWILFYTLPFSISPSSGGHLLCFRVASRFKGGLPDPGHVELEEDGLWDLCYPIWYGGQQPQLASEHLKCG